MSNSINRLLMMAALSLCATSAMADNWRNECGKMSTYIPSACSEIEKSIAVLDVYKPPQPFLEYQLQSYTPGSDSSGGASGGGGGGSILLTNPDSSQQQQQDSGGTW
ncbi:hypothetical protein [Candidatus Berkiella aquae]|uniref:Uncharacterized protein n=1 Tax=Candidatus Berkiella aquae TaxID=295108 RepID=A0A0Q9YKI2_9GAMM|nr:hypothetical protein [Candidatus Berkiella aquae]MCS5711143.1 hypothetical protein [Candidatus Berkiella aquae]